MAFWKQGRWKDLVDFVKADQYDANDADVEMLWTIAEAWLAHEPADRSPWAVSDAVGVPVMLVEAALAYWADHRNEIDVVISRHHRAQDEALAAWERRQALKSA